MKPKIILFLLVATWSLKGLGQNEIIGKLLDRPVKVTTINGNTFLQKDLTDYLNMTLGKDTHVSENFESDVHTNLAVLKGYFMRPHPSVITLQKYFALASEEFAVPVSLLMIIGQIENNWTQTGPTIDQGWGIMHLVQNDYSNTLGEAAQLLGLPEQVLKDDALQNIRGAAALIKKYAGGQINSIEDWFPAVARFSGLISPALRNEQAINYFETLQKGVSAQTVWGETISITSLEVSKEIIERYWLQEVGGNTSSKTASADYGPAIFNAAATCNYANGRTSSIDTWVNHWIGTGTYLGTISWFQTCPCPTSTPCASCPSNTRGCTNGVHIGASSAHFVIKNSNGEITQMVAVANTAYHCGASGFPANNPRSIGVEHEATAANPGMWNSTAMINASATMACYFKQQIGFPTTQNASPGICGHNDMPGTSTTCPGPLPWSTWMSSFNNACTVSPPLCNNDNSCSPMALTINTSGNCVTTGCSTVNATPPSPDIPFLGASTCTSPYQSGRYDDDVWFTITPTTTNQIAIRVTPTSNTSNFDVVIGLYQGNCSSPTQVSCADLFGVGVAENLIFTPQAGNTYRIRVFSYGIGSSFSGNFNICVFSNTSLPDLTITAGTQNVTPTTVTAGSNVTASCSEDNSGNASAAANHVTLWLSADNVLNTSNDIFLGQIPFPSVPASSNTIILNTTVQIPANTCPGSYYLFFWADGNQVVAESIEGNNFASRIITVNANFNAGTVSGSSPLCIGATANYTSSGTSGGSWSSSNTSVATVNSSTGLVTAVGAGTVNIIYTVGAACGNPVSSSKSLTVSPNVSAGTVSGNSPLCISTTATYTSNGVTGGTWSSSNTTVATVNAGTGLVTAVSAGTASIIYTINSGCGSPVSSSRTLTVSQNVSAGTISGASPLCIGNTATYTSNGSSGGVWSSSNTSVATVNSTTGQVNAASAGTSNIIYTINSGCGSPVSSSKALTVSANVNAGTVNGASPLCIGSSSTYTSNGTPGGSWSSSNASVATVNSNTGQVTAVGAGTVNIIYTVTNCSGNPLTAIATLTVTPNVSAGTVNGVSPLCIGTTAGYTSNGATGGTWSSSNTSVATVNSNTGLVSALSAGTADITYTLNAGCGSPVSSLRSLTVSPNVSAGNISGNSPLCIGASANYTSSGTTGGTWSSSNTSVATVNPATGTVAALNPGTTNIIYTVGTGCGSPVSASKSLSVSSNIVAGTVSGATTLCVGSSTTYTSNGTQGGLWSSSNPSVAAIDVATGVAIAMNTGTTTIIYTVINCNGSPLTASANLTITPGISPAIAISQTTCSGTSVGFQAVAVNGGANPQYNWQIVSGTGNITGSGTSIVVDNAANGTQVRCTLVSNLTCASPASVASNIFTINCVVTGLPGINGLEEFSIFPNPSDGIFNIKMKLNNLKLVHFRILNTAGQTIYESGNYQVLGQQTKSISLSSMPAGYYFLETWIGNDRLVRPVVIQHP